MIFVLSIKSPTLLKYIYKKKIIPYKYIYIYRERKIKIKDSVFANFNIFKDFFQWTKVFTRNPMNL